MSKKQKKNLRRIIIALVSFFIVLISTKIFDFNWVIVFFLYLIIYLYIGYDVIKKAFLNIINGNMLDENFLMVVATFGAFGLGLYNGLVNNVVEGFDEACAVLLFYQVGEWFQDYAVRKSRKSIADLMDIKAEYANKKTENGYQEVEPESLKVGDIILVKPGEKVAVDGISLGSSSFDAKALTGESRPTEINEGSTVLSGYINLTNSVEVKVTKEYVDSTVSKILELVENASNKKSKSESFINKFSRYYTPIVVCLALCLAIIPSLITSNWSLWIYRALNFLVVSCPCALVISVPLSFFNSIGKASRLGVLVKGSIYLEEFNKVDTFVFDKTGTLTKGNFNVIKVYPNDTVLEYAAIAEGKSNHPIAQSIKKAYGKTIDETYENREISGKGIISQGKHIIYCGNEALIREHNINYEKCNDIGTIIYVAVDNEFKGYILIGDEIKENAYDVVKELNNYGQTIMLTGDSDEIARAVKNKVNVNDYRANLLPIDKVNYIEEIMKQHKVCFIGDGINDAPVLMMANVGISMGQIGSDAAIEASDIVLMNDDLQTILLAKKIAKKTMRIVNENIYFALMVKVIILLLSALGITNMWFAVFGDVGVAIIAVLNSLR